MTQARTDAEKEARRMPMAELLPRLQAEVPTAWRMAEIVGRWVWITFDSKPDKPTRDVLKVLGFRWNHRRGAWQHSCGVESISSKGDPRARYWTAPVAGLTVAEKDALSA